jgi:hypothetical protein
MSASAEREVEEGAGAESTAAAPTAGAGVAAPEKPVEEKPEPRIYGETRLDRASSALMSVILCVALAVGWVFLQFITQQAFAVRDQSRIEIVEVVGGTGGSPDVDVNARASVNVAGGAPDRFASNNMEDAADFEEPQVEMTNQVVLDAFVEAPPDQVMNVDMADALPNAGPVASGRRSSKVGNGPIGYGMGGGPGDGGVSREQRWVILYPAGQTPDEYARQLDFFGIELAVPQGSSSLEYVSKFAAGSATRRVGLVKADKRMYFLWQGGTRKAHDVTLLQRAGVQVGNKPIFQFFPRDLEDQLAQMEVRFAGRQPAQIRSTRFSIAAAGSGYEFRVVSQDPLR